MASGACIDSSRTEQEEEEAARGQLAHALEQFELSFSYAIFGALGDVVPVNMGLTIFGFGDLDMPLNEGDLRQVIALSRPRYGNSRQARLGKCNTWELDPEQLAFLNPEWKSCLLTVGAYAAKGLGMSDDIVLTAEAQLEKMLICGEGAILDRNLSTKKPPNTFATMAVFLPSTYQGGEVTVKFGTRVRNFEPSKRRQPMCCWLPDVELVSRPISLGYSCVLLYHLTTKEGTAAPCLDKFSTAPQAIGEALSLWANLDWSKRQRHFLCHQLQDHYDEPNLSLEGLQPLDLAATQQLINAASKLPVEVLFAHTEREIIRQAKGIDERMFEYLGPKKYSDWHQSILKDHYRLRSVMSLNGEIIDEDLALQEHDITHTGSITGRKINIRRETYDEIVEDTFVARRNFGTAVIVVHHESLVHFFSARNQTEFTGSPNSCPQVPISLLLKVCLRPNPSKTVFYALVEACQDAWDEESESGTKSRAFSGIVYSDLLRAAVQLGEFEFFKQVAKNRNMKDTVPLAFFTWLREWVSNDESEAASRFEQIRAGLRYCLPSCFDDLFAAIEAFAPLEDSGNNCPAIAQFAQNELCSRAQQVEPSLLSKSDGRAMVKSVRYFGNARFFISEVVVQILSLCYDDPEVIFGFLFQIQQDGIKGMPREEAALISHSVAADLLINANPGEWRPMQVIEALFTKAEERSAVKSEDIAEFLSIFLEANPEDDGLVLEFMSNLIQTLPDLHARELISLWVPFLSALTPVLASNNIPLTDPVCQNLYLAFITKLVDEFVGHEPPEFSDNVRATKSSDKNTKVRKQWYKRRVEAVALLKTFDQSHLKALLGSKYDMLFRMQHLIAAKPPPLQKPLTQLAGGANQSPASPRRGAKRKAKQMN